MAISLHYDINQTIKAMKTERMIYAIMFFSNDYDITKCRKMDLMYMAGLSFYGDSGYASVNPEDKILSARIRSNYGPKENS
jgi:hypothetical protein